MARSKLPNPLDRRHLVERELAPEKALRLAEAYLEEGRTVEALEFLRKAGAADRLDALRAEAIASGDAFLLRSGAAAGPRPPHPDEWRALAEAAAAAGKEVYAVEARRQADAGEV